MSSFKFTWEFGCCVSDRSGILFCPDKAKKIERIARPEGLRPKKTKSEYALDDRIRRGLLMGFLNFFANDTEALMLDCGSEK